MLTGMRSMVHEDRDVLATLEALGMPACLRVQTIRAESGETMGVYVE
jgi:hypothetical protein